MNSGKLTFQKVSLILTLFLIPGATSASDIGTPDIALLKGLYPGKTFSPYAQRSFPSNVYWGDTHLHTGLSLDAGLFGNILDHEDAYRFARGEEIKSSSGLPVKLARPLDWLVITDHSDMMGIATDIQNGAPNVMAVPKGREWAEGFQKGGEAAGKAPKFMVLALRDTIGANLDRIQIIKGWLDKDGKTHERIYDVAVSDGREIGPDGPCKTPVGNTVDLEAATWTNTIGASELTAVWTDPDFEPGLKAFYYARILEIPTPRWILYDKLRFGAEIPEAAKLTHQERAYTSPIRYKPGD